jgi:formate dehydrogenase major subunit
MTNSWTDIGVSDCVLIMGSNAAENHPIAMKWVLRAKDRGGEIIHVDPRFTRTSAKADIYAPLRSGTDIAFLGGMINYILEKDLIQNDYVVSNTNAAFIVNTKYDFKDGLFSGYNPEKRAYDKSLWAIEKDEKGIPKRDQSLQNERCVYQLMKKHYARYDLNSVSNITGTPKEDLIKVYEAYTETGKPDKVGTMLYAMGWTQHTVGTQNIRAASIIQLLLGNMGMAGGGVNALRGESNVQGITDQAVLFHIIPGYNPSPKASDVSLEKYNEKNTPKTANPSSVNWWGNRPKYIASFLKSMYGENATKENEFGYQLLPKLDDGQNASFLFMFDEMLKGKFSGFICLGMNPACSLPNANQSREALSKLDWMVAVDIFESETTNFWKGPGMDPNKVKTEVFLLPACSYVEREGSLSDSARTAQWRYKAIEPIGESKADGQIIHEIYMKLKTLYEKDKGVFPDPILKLKWDYAKAGKVDTHLVAKDINGYFLEDVPEHPVDKKAYKKGTLVPSFVFLLTDGRTSCGNWIYSGSYTEAGNMMARRDKTPVATANIFPKWAWAWPVNRRIIYNRASVDMQGNPIDPKRAVIKWDAENKKWVGDVPDGPAPPMGMEGGKLPFIMKPDGVASIFGPGLTDGPFPEHYEPLECPIEKNPLSSQRVNPTTSLFKEYKFTTCDPRFPFVATTYRVTEHWQTGLMTRYQSLLVETEPQMFVELSEELAELRGIKNGERVLVSSPRGKLEAIAMVTKRWAPFKVAGQTIHEVGMTFHYGWLIPKNGGESANLLTPTIGDANTAIPEYKAFLVNVEKLPAKGKGR